jgi:hypothetical protein
MCQLRPGPNCPRFLDRGTEDCQEGTEGERKGHHYQAKVDSEKVNVENSESIWLMNTTTLHCIKQFSHGLFGIGSYAAAGYRMPHERNSNGHQVAFVSMLLNQRSIIS